MFSIFKTVYNMLESATQKIAGMFPFVRLATPNFSAWLALTVIVASGCGKSENATYRAGGKVTFPDGAPLTTGWVSFRPVNPAARTSPRGEIQPDGSFELTTFERRDGALPGRYQAIVAAQNVQNMRLGPRNSSPEPLIADRFANFETSKLEFTITEDPEKNQFKIVVTK
jgi:hypothetical protein